MKKNLALLMSSLFLLACSPNELDFKSDVPTTRPSLEDRISTGETENDSEVSEPEVQPESLPVSINLEMPFYPQAPESDWSLPWQEACEEASIILAYYAVTGESLSRAEFKTNIVELVDWQKEHFGDYIHSSVEQTAQMLEGHFNFSDFRILENPSLEDLKKELAMGNPIVAPFAGRMLQNPFYSGEGPYYHVLVIKGYDGENFITNDVGTKRGENFIYPYKRMMEALHDYQEPGIESAPKRVLVLDASAI